MTQQKQQSTKQPKYDTLKDTVSSYQPNPKAIQPTPEIYYNPPGLLGEISEFIYSQATRPVQEIALAGAIGLMSGIVGRSYNVSGTGLNQYTLLIAPSSTGKEAIADGIDALVNSVGKSDFVGPSDIDDTDAIIGHFHRNSKSFVSIVGEFGAHLQRMVSKRQNASVSDIRRFILDVYNKSGHGKVLRPALYIGKKRDRNEIKSPAFSIIGESEPTSFYEALHSGMIETGLLPRFTIIEYDGPRVKRNPQHMSVKPSESLVKNLSKLCELNSTLAKNDSIVDIYYTPGGLTMLDDFDEYCDSEINNTKNNITRKLWDRAHMKALKLAGLVAVGAAPYEPVINGQMASWAIGIVKHDVRRFIEKFECGEIGENNEKTQRILKAKSALLEFSTSEWDKVSGLAKGYEHLHANKIIPYVFIQRRLSGSAVFKKYPAGNAQAVKDTIATLLEEGIIKEISAHDRGRHSYQGAGYKIIDTEKLK